MKKLYNVMQIEVIVLSTEDVITSSPNTFDDVTDDIFSPHPKN